MRLKKKSTIRRKGIWTGQVSGLGGVSGGESRIKGPESETDKTIEILILDTSTFPRPLVNYQNDPTQRSRSGIHHSSSTLNNDDRNPSSSTAPTGFIPHTPLNTSMKQSFNHSITPNPFSTMSNLPPPRPPPLSASPGRQPPPGRQLLNRPGSPIPVPVRPTSSKNTASDIYNPPPPGFTRTNRFKKRKIPPSPIQVPGPGGRGSGEVILSGIGSGSGSGFGNGYGSGLRYGSGGVGTGNRSGNGNVGNGSGRDGSGSGFYKRSRGDGNRNTGIENRFGNDSGNRSGGSGGGIRSDGIKFGDPFVSTNSAPVEGGMRVNNKKGLDRLDSHSETNVEDRRNRVRERQEDPDSNSRYLNVSLPSTSNQEPKRPHSAPAFNRSGAGIQRSRADSSEKTQSEGEKEDDEMDRRISEMFGPPSLSKRRDVQAVNAVYLSPQSRSSSRISTQHPERNHDQTPTRIRHDSSQPQPESRSASNPGKRMEAEGDSTRQDQKGKGRAVDDDAEMGEGKDDGEAGDQVGTSESEREEELDVEREEEIEERPEFHQTA